MRKHIFILLVFLNPFATFAGTYLGATIGYNLLASIPGYNQYEVYVNLYRNCNSSVGYNPTLMIGIYKGDTLVANPSLDYISKTNLLPMPAGVCVEVALYKSVVVLPQLQKDYLLEYQQCCWGSGIANIYQPNQEGFTVTATIPPIPNSSPRYAQTFPMYAVLNQPFNYTLSAIDTADNDIPRYFLNTIYRGGNPNNPTPNPPSPPPFDEISFFPPYNISNMISGTIPLVYDSVMGAMTASPEHFGDFLLGVEMKEYRNGNIIAKYRSAFLMHLSSNLPSAIDIPLDSDISIYPNPATNVLFVRSKNKEITQIQCFDMKGKMLFETNENAIAIESLSPGMYILFIHTKNGNVVKKWVKEGN